MRRPIRHAAVLGAGTMGAQIAAHLANAGVTVTLCDVTLEAAAGARARLPRLKPAPLFRPDLADRIRPAALDDPDATRGADWIIEAVIEDLEIKRALLARLDQPSDGRPPSAFVSSNTSGIPLESLAEGRSDAFRRRWLGTHFFNPPRYLPLVELIATPDTDPAVADDLGAFLDRGLGKGVVRAKDRPGFIANRIGLFAAARTLELVASGAFTIEEADALSGPLIGRPKSATFRTADLAGLDILARVAADLAARLGAGGPPFVLPDVVGRMIAAGRLGDKTGGGFYRRASAEPGAPILTIDLATLDYRDRQAPSIAALEAVRAIPALEDRLRALFTARDRAGDFVRRTLGATIVYAATIAAEVADSPDDVDRAMRWGFGWELGPFEIWDAVGLETVLTACAVATPPPLIADRLARGDARVRPGPLPPASPDLVTFRPAGTRLVQANSGATLVDLGDGVLGLDIHSKMNAIGGDLLQMIHAGLARAEAGFEAFVIGSDADLFSAGANLALLLIEAQDGNWEDVDDMVRGFQAATQAIRRAAVPVVVAPRGLCLGGGCEIVLQATRVQAAAELYIGLVETGVGLVPAGGGSTEILMRANARDAADRAAAVQDAFEHAALARVSTSAPDAARLGYLRDADGLSMNRERVLADARSLARHLAAAGERRAPEGPVAVGGPDLFARLSLGVHLAERAGRASAHDALVSRKLAWILTGGDIPRATTVTAAYLRDLEREAFLSLCGEAKTRARIAHTLKTGKPLRN
ncbi:MAG: 3-hydroxyacyl-CoA dehydrogenase NAD-binding domain-containing protein [Vicinamibacterales bacterium]